jgi:hypothetical protein
MKKYLFSAILLFLFSLLFGEENIQLLKYDSENLAITKQMIQDKDSNIYQSYKFLLKRANRSLNLGPWSVMDKPEVPPSGNMHDYMSLSPYWWPDPDKPDGLPYIRRDGIVNPEREKYDKRPFVHVHENSLILGLAYYFSEDEKYAKKASELLRIWFLDDATKMNPNMNYGQGVRGRKPGRGVGLIEMKNLLDIIDSIELIKKSKYWTEDDHNQMISWFKEYFYWLQTSEISKDEERHENNHGSWFDVQYAYIANYIGETDEAKKMLSAFHKRIDIQVQPDGSQPHELERTRAFSYSLFNLRAHLLAAKLGKKLGIDILNYQSPQGASISKEIEFLIPYAIGKKEWPYKQINKWEKTYNDMYQVLKIAAHEYNDTYYLEIANKIRPNKDFASLVNLFYPAKK